MVNVLHVSDTHLRADDRRLRGVDPRVRLASVLEAVAREAFVPDLVIHSGDIADDESAVGARLAFDALSALGGHVLGVPGNHDLPASVAQVFTTTDADLAGWRAIGLDTVIEGRVGGTVEGRLDALADALATDVPLIVVMHHPLLSRSSDPELTFRGSDEFRAMLDRRTRPVLMLTGHTHQAYDVTLDADPTRWLRLLGAPAVLNAWRHDGRDHVDAPGETGARLIVLGDGTVETRLVNA